MCWGGNLRLNVRAQGFIKDELEDDDEYENEKNVKMRIKYFPPTVIICLLLSFVASTVCATVHRLCSLRCAAAAVYNDCALLTGLKVTLRIWTLLQIFLTFYI